MKVLVVDDQPEIRQIVRRVLEREDFDVEEAADGPTALREAATTSFDIMVLDLHLPGMSGLDVLAHLRQEGPEMHVVMLTGAGSEADRVLGLMSGADDYLVKPFSARELAARLVAVRRRLQRDRPTVIEAGGLRIDSGARTVTVGGEPIDLTRREFDLLSHLAANADRTFTRAELLEAVWESSAEWQSPKTVTEHVRRIRHKIELDPLNPVTLISVQGFGYRFDPAGRLAHTRPAVSSDEMHHASIVVVGATIVHANTLALGLLQAPDDEVIGREVTTFVAPQSVGAITAPYEESSKAPSARPEVITLVTGDGRDVAVEISSTPLTWEGKPARHVTLQPIAHDSSKLQELAIGIRTDVTEAIVIADAQLRIQSFNAAAEELYGWTEEEVIGLETMEVMPWVGDGAVADEAREAFQRDGRWHGVVTQRRRDGRTVTVLLSSTLLRDHGGQPIGVITVNRPVEPGTGRRVVERSTADAMLEKEIRQGIEHDEFVVHYQPIVRLEDGSWAGCEALVRWLHPERGILMPDAFIDVAERSGLIIDLDERVLNKACRQAAAWQRAGHDLYISVNLSARELTDDRVADRVAGSLEQAGLPAGKLWLELTETALVQDLGQAAEILRRIARIGVRISIDDFGTGWSSLTYLSEFPVGSLKVDRVFVSRLGAGSADDAIVSSIISLGRELDLFVIAEGIETEAQRSLLVELGCVLGQGYLFGRPQAPEQLDIRADG